MAITADDLAYLRRCVDLARTAIEDGDEPFGSILVSAGGRELYADRNRVKDGDETRHPELAIAQWAVTHLTPEERATATVYTSGEHCPMCAAGHGWVGLGRIVYVASSAQLAGWRAEWGAPSAPVAALPITQVVPDAVVEGPVPELEAEIRALHRRRFPA